MRWIKRYYKRDVEARRESRVRVTNSPRSDGPHSPPSTTPIFISKNASTFFLQNMQHKYPSLKIASTFLHHSQHWYSSLKMAQIFFNICNTNFHLKKDVLTSLQHLQHQYSSSKNVCLAPPGALTAILTYYWSTIHHSLFRSNRSSKTTWNIKFYILAWTISQQDVSKIESSPSIVATRQPQLMDTTWHHLALHAQCAIGTFGQLGLNCGTILRLWDNF